MSLQLDISQLARQWAGAPSVIGTAVLTLALGLGLTTFAQFSGSALLGGSPRALAEPGTLVTIYTSRFNGALYGRSSMPDLTSIREQVAEFASVGAIDDTNTGEITYDQVRRAVRVSAVSGSVFGTLGIAPHIGTLIDDRQVRMHPRSAVISHRLWLEIGAPPLPCLPLYLGSEVFSIIGVLPPSFTGLRMGRVSDLWIAASPQQDRADRLFEAVARLRPDASASDVNGLLQSVSRRLAARYPISNRGSRDSPDAPRQFVALPYSYLEPASRSYAVVVIALVTTSTVLLFLTAVINAAGLLLVRWSARSRDWAVMAAMGANGWQIARSALIECVAIATASGFGSLLVCFCAARLLLWGAGYEVTGFLALSFSPTQLISISAVSVVVAGLLALPVMLEQRWVMRNPRATIAGTGRRFPSHNGQPVLMSLQVALSTTLLMAAIWSGRGLSTVLKADHAFASQDAVVITMDRAGFRPADLAKLRTAASLVGAPAVALTTSLPLGRPPIKTFTIRLGEAAVPERCEAGVRFVSSEYFRAINLPFIEGRTFTDRGDRPQVVVNEAFARTCVGLSAVGQAVDSNGQSLKILGVVRNELFRALQGPVEAAVYMPMREGFAEDVHIVFSGEGRRHLSTEDIAGLFTTMPVKRVMRLEEHLRTSLGVERVVSTLVFGFSGCAIMLVLIGTYSSISDTIRRRAAEISLRVCLGARPSHIVRLVLLRVLLPSVSGSLCGAACGVVIHRIALGAVFGLPPLGVVTLGLPISIMVVVMILATWLAVRRCMNGMSASGSLVRRTVASTSAVSRGNLLSEQAGGRKEA